MSKPTARLHDIEILTPFKVGRKITPKTVKLGLGTLKQKGPAEQGDSYTVKLTETEFENLYDLIWNGSWGVSYLQLPDPNTLNDNQLRVISGMRAEYKKNRMVDCTLITQRVHPTMALQATSQELPTAWDSVLETFDTAYGPWAEKIQSSQTMDGYFWYADIGAWQIHADDYIYCSTHNAGNYDACYLRRMSAHDLTASAFTLSVDVAQFADGWSGLKFRAHHDSAPTTYGYGYLLFMRNGTNALSLYRCDGADLKDLASYNQTIATDTYYTLKVVVEGGRIDSYVNDIFQGTIIDKKYDAGFVGVVTALGTANHRFKNFEYDLLKPVVTPLPVGAQSLSQPITYSVIGNEGVLQHIIGATGEIRFEQHVAAIRGDSAIVWISYDEGTGTPVDYARGHTIAVGGAPTWEQEDSLWHRWGYRCRKNDYLNIDAEPDLGPMGHHFTMITCFKINSWLTQPGGANVQGWAYLDRLATVGKSIDVIGYQWRVEMSMVMGTIQFGPPSEPVELGKIYCFVWTFDGYNWKLYANGKHLGTKSEVPIFTSRRSEDWFSNGNWTGAWTDITHYHFSLHDRVFSEAEAKYISRGFGEFSGGECRAWDSDGYEIDDSQWSFLLGLNEGRGGTCFDKSGNGRDFTNGANWIWSLGDARTPPDLHCAESDRGTVNRHTSLASANLPFNDTAKTDFTCQITVKLDTTPSAATHFRLMHYNWSSTAGRWLLSLSNDAGTYYLTFYAYNDTPSQVTLARAAFPTVAPQLATGNGAWYTFVATMNGDYMDLYINGQEFPSYQTHTDLSAQSFGAGDNTTMYINDPATGTAIDGHFDNPGMGYFNMTAAEIQKRFELGPINHDRAHWRRRYAPVSTKDLKGRQLIIENSLTRVVFQHHDGKAVMPELFTFGDGYWKQVGHLQFILTSLGYQVYGTNFSDSIKQQSDIRLVEVTRDRVVVEITTEVQDDEEQAGSPIKYRVILQSGFNGVLWETVEPKEWNSYYLVHYMSPTGSSPGTSLMNRFHWVPGNDPEDALLTDASAARIYSNDNWGAYFGPGLDTVFCVFQNQALGEFSSQMDLTNDRLTTPYVYGDDALAPSYRGGVAFTDHNTSNLRMASDNLTTNQGTTDTDSNCATGTRIQLPTQWNRVWLQVENDWQVGVYMMWVRMRESIAGGTVRMGVNDPGGFGFQYGPTDNVAITSSYVWYGTPIFITQAILDAGDMELSVQKSDATAAVIWLDQVVCFPVSNAHNWPQDQAHQAMRTRQLELIAKK